MSAVGDNELLLTAIGRVALTLDIAELFKRGDRLGCCLPGDPQRATQLGRVPGTCVDGLKRELMTGRHPRMAPPVKLDDNLVDHRSETAK